ncbi:beta-ketoacyl-[acyl-carrier-protein] synthase family protein [Photobacterium gaetbulicola]|uniref:Putative 3-oxoacyl-(Acyl-carrier-protein) synthase II KasB n=1 Tax=Photobacterium gaetbulicola Gung47 TaxID=658445 RepID=A0A0C5WN94_9GAMM|nr:beta-ketoacyl-[acyl-carrier-protein] synthase family protein [Photobacterium gaetbulicola]AJR06554.1 putative 3-oxoacyl-(Acyl-carrier-protein) synthase II KasB [Photobacterium gaetbulicola Gung47]PSU03528.1 beta-ketoacyl-[acyl-carrier-protein] synthase family protein [Photobacterium gaetbulicola]
METVAVTGIGLVTGEHLSAEDQFSALFNGESTIKKDARLLDLGIDNIVSSPISSSVISKLRDKHIKCDDNNYEGTYVAFDAVVQAVHFAGLRKEMLNNAGLFLGINKIFPNNKDLNVLWDYYRGGNIADDDKSKVLQRLKYLKPDLVSDYIASRLSIRGPSLVFGDACAAGAAAIMSGFRRIQQGQLDVAICGASEFGTQPIMQLLFTKLGATCSQTFTTPAQTSRPFDKDRAGCVLADAAAFLILENAEFAKRRGKKVLAYISGASRQIESYKLTATNPDGSLYRECIEKALQDARLSPDAISHINAHGTSTVSNDQAESRAIASLFSKTTSVTSTKSALGHSLAASGAIEAVLSVMSIEKQQVLPTLNFIEPKPDEPRLNIVKWGASQAIDHVLSNSFGFGGENCCLIFSKECP